MVSLSLYFLIHKCHGLRRSSCWTVPACLGCEKAAADWGHCHLVSLPTRTHKRQARSCTTEQVLTVPMFPLPKKLSSSLGSLSFLGNDPKLAFRTEPSGIAKLADQRGIAETDDVYWSQVSSRAPPCLLSRPYDSPMCSTFKYSTARPTCLPSSHPMIVSAICQGEMGL